MEPGAKPEAKQADAAVETSTAGAEDAAARLPSRADGALPMALFIVGMAGAGKSTFCAALYSYLTGVLKKRVYCVNLDPAVDTVNFPCNVNVCDTVNHKNVMKEYNLGPNGAILTSLNLFATKFEGVISLLEKRAPELDYVLFDTPGQIEVFNWSASGTIILESVSLVLPTTLLYLMDTVRCSTPTTLMSTLMYSCSISLKSKLSCLNVFTKCDLKNYRDEIESWITDYREFCDAAEREETYASSLAKSCCLCLQDFYRDAPRVAVGVNSETAELIGFGALVEQIDGPLRAEYFDSYLPWVRSERERAGARRRAGGLARLKKFEEEAGQEDASE